MIVSGIYENLFIGFATAHYKIVCFDIGVNPTWLCRILRAQFNWKCCLVFDAWLCWTTVPTAIRRAYAVCIFLRWLFVAYLKWRSILHIFKKSLASRTAGEHCSFSWDRTGSKLSSFYFVWLVSSNYKPEFRFLVRFSRQQPDDAIRHDPVRT